LPEGGPPWIKLLDRALRNPVHIGIVGGPRVGKTLALMGIEGLFQGRDRCRWVRGSWYRQEGLRELVREDLIRGVEGRGMGGILLLDDAHCLPGEWLEWLEARLRERHPRDFRCVSTWTQTLEGMGEGIPFGGELLRTVTVEIPEKDGIRGCPQVPVSEDTSSRQSLQSLPYGIPMEDLEGCPTWEFPREWPELEGIRWELTLPRLRALYVLHVYVHVAGGDWHRAAGILDVSWKTVRDVAQGRREIHELRHYPEGKPSIRTRDTGKGKRKNPGKCKWL